MQARAVWKICMEGCTGKHQFVKIPASSRLGSALTLLLQVTSFELSEVWHYQSIRFPISTCNDFSYRYCKLLSCKSLRGKKSQLKSLNFKHKMPSDLTKIPATPHKLLPSHFWSYKSSFERKKVLTLWKLPPLTWESRGLSRMDILDFATGKAPPDSSISSGFSSRTPAVLAAPVQQSTQTVDFLCSICTAAFKPS